ncbi:MAG: endonuclease [Parcubacteria group bacterium]|nr:MAG: endonuclease [Parcubacteria group bacterium]
MRDKQYFVYILATYKNGTLYTGVTNNLLLRVRQHKEKINPRSFTARYNVNNLMYYETFDNIHDAISREKYIKAGPRKKKIALIKKDNPEWCDLHDDLLDL